MSDFLLEDNFDATLWDKPKKGVKKGKMNRWDSRLRSTKPTGSFRNTSGSGIWNVYAVIPPLSSTKKGSQLATRPATSRVGGKRILDSRKKTSVASALHATFISGRTQGNIMNFRLRGWAKKGLIKLYWPLVFILKKIGSPKPSTGNRNSRKTSVLVADSDSLRVKIEISIWDRLFAYVGLVIFAGLAIKPLVIPDVTARIAIVLLATHTLVRRFR